jgi:hypothetical protein
MTRTTQLLVQAVFALNRGWFVNDKGSVEQADAFENSPDGFGDSITAIVSGVIGLVERVQAMATVTDEVARRAGGLYLRRR